MGRPRERRAALRRAPAGPEPRPCPQACAPSPARIRQTPSAAAAPAPLTVACTPSPGTRPQRPGIVPAAQRAPGSCRLPPRPEINPTALRGPRCLPGAPARAPRSLLPGTLGGPASPAPWSTGPRASANSSGSSRPWAAAAVPVRPREDLHHCVCPAALVLLPTPWVTRAPREHGRRRPYFPPGRC